MRFLVSVSILLLVAVISSCQDRRNIKVTGKIIDDLTSAPIPNAEVVVLCWYMHNVDDESFKKEAISTDESGNFVVKFDKGHKVDIASQANGFLPMKKYVKLESNEINLELRIKRDKKNGTLISHLTTGSDFVDTTERAPFLRLRTQNNLTVTYGFDFTTLTTKVDTLNCDFWFKVERTPTTIVAPKSGGIIPIQRKEVKSSLLYEMEHAPTTGYLKSFALTGDEEGFFIKCRDGRFAKVIFAKGIMDVNRPFNGGSFKDQGRYFSYLYQPNGTTDLAFSDSKIDLERFLVDFVYK
jgi:hypothetical protein